MSIQAVRALAVALFAWLVLTVPAPAGWWPRFQSTPLVIAACPQSSGYDDGCAAAVPASTQHADFFTGYASQSRPVGTPAAFTNATMPAVTLPSLQPQNGVYPNRPPWNVAGVDYAVGLPANQVLKVPGVDALPPGSGCTINAAGSKPRRVTCSNTTTPLVFDGWDFGANDCVQLRIAASAAQGNALVVRNSRFVWGPNCEAGSNAGEAAIYVDTPSAITSITLTNNLFDGRAQDYGGAITCPAAANTYATQNCNQQIVALLNGTYDVLANYNTWLNVGARAMQVYTAGKIVVQYNYAEAFYGNTAHGEFMLTFAPTPNVKSPLWEFGYNTILQPAKIPNAQVTTAFAYAAAGTQVARHTTHHNTEVSNLLGTSVQVNMKAAITDGMTFVVGGTTYTFRNNPSAANDVKVTSDQTDTTNAQGTVIVTAAANNLRVTFDNLIAALSAASDADTTHYTFSSGWYQSSNQIYALGAPTVAISGTAVALPNQLNISYVNRDSRETVDVLAYTDNYMDPTGTYGCLFTQAPITVGAYEVHGNVNMLKAAGTIQPSNLSALNDAMNPDSTANVTPCDGHGP